jgi:hypothetical protein
MRTELTIDTDASLMRASSDLLAEAFPKAELEAYGPIAESVSPDTVQWIFAGTLATFTITGGVGPAITALRAWIGLLRGAYESAKSRGVELRPTVIRYRDQTVILDVSSPDPEVALESLLSVLQNKEGAGD